MRNVRRRLCIWSRCCGARAPGALGIVSTAYYFIPMGLNGRVQRAYDEAVASVPGATGLVDVTIKENWYWWLIGTARTVTVTGEAIREIK
jgi:hypothetical protein